MDAARATTRLDKWLFFARFFKTRSLAAKVVSAGHVRVNAARVSKAAQAVGVGDTLTFAQADHIRVVRIVDLGTRRGPAPEAQALYQDLTPAVDPALSAPRVRTGRRPTKKDRRKLGALRGFDLD